MSRHSATARCNHAANFLPDSLAGSHHVKKAAGRDSLKEFRNCCLYNLVRRRLPDQRQRVLCYGIEGCHCLRVSFEGALRNNQIRKL